jgi:hypothetical protein
MSALQGAPEEYRRYAVALREALQRALLAPSARRRA